MKWLAFVLGICVSLPASAQQTDVAKVVQAEANAAMSQGQIPGLSIAVLHQNRRIYAHGFGRAELENNLAASEDTIFRINSITKAFTAVAILQLAEKGKLTLDDRASKWFPEYTRPGHDPTLQQLLLHTSGLTGYEGPTFHQALRQNLSAKGWLDTVNDERLYRFLPGTDWSYSNVGYDLLGIIVEKVSGNNLEEYFRANIFNPLGMNATGFCNTQRVVKNRAFSYSIEHAAPVRSESWGTFGNASGRLCSNVMDLSRFLPALESDKILSAPSLKRMRRRGQLQNRAFDYALGTRFGHFGEHAVIAYTGSGEQWTSAIVELPREHWTVIALCNADVPNWSAARIAADILRKLSGLPSQIANSQTQRKPVPPEVAKKIAGVWQPPNDRAMEFVVTGEGIAVRPVGIAVPLAPLVYIGGGRFTFGNNAPAEGMEFDFALDNPPSVEVYQDGVFTMVVLRKPHS